MIRFKFNEVNIGAFLNEYWQKKPLLIKQALPNFISPISADELAGLSLENDFQSKIIIGKDKEGPFSEKIFTKLPEKDWTLLVQSVDRFIDEVYDLINNFDFIPRWRFEIDASARTVHGALLDAQILAQVYLAMTGGQSTLFSNDGSSNEQDQKNQKIVRVNSDIGKIKVVQANEQELEAHNNYFSQT